MNNVNFSSFNNAVPAFLQGSFAKIGQLFSKVVTVITAVPGYINSNPKAAAVAILASGYALARLAALAVAKAEGKIATHCPKLSNKRVLDVTTAVVAAGANLGLAKALKLPLTSLAVVGLTGVVVAAQHLYAYKASLASEVVAGSKAEDKAAAAPTAVVEDKAAAAPAPAAAAPAAAADGDNAATPATDGGKQAA